MIKFITSGRNFRPCGQAEDNHSLQSFIPKIRLAREIEPLDVTFSFLAYFYIITYFCPTFPPIVSKLPNKFI